MTVAGHGGVCDSRGLGFVAHDVREMSRDLV